MQVQHLAKNYRSNIQEQLQSEVMGRGEAPDIEELSRIIYRIVQNETAYMSNMDEAKRQDLAEQAVNDFLKLGILQGLIDDPSVDEIMVNGLGKTYVERHGKLERENGVEFHDENEIDRIISRILTPLNKTCNESKPYVDARLDDGSRVNIIIPPVARGGKIITIRKFKKDRMDGQGLIECGTASTQMMNFLRSAVIGGCNILVSGGTGAGKTTLLNVLSGFIPPTERIITIEDTAELQLQQDHVVTLEARNDNSEGSGEVSIHDLLVNSLRMRPDRIIIGECRSVEADEMLQAMNTGHDGSMTTIHANDPISAFERIEDMVMKASPGLPELAIKRQIRSAIDLVVQIKRYKDGTRKISEVRAITGEMENGNIVTEPLYVYREQDIKSDEDRRVVGAHIPCGFQPPRRIHDKIISKGAPLRREWFMERGGR